MTLTLCVLLWAVPGQEDAFVEYEDRVLQRLTAYEARVLTRVRALGGGPSEVQVLDFPSEKALAAFMRDPEREALSALRDRVVNHTELVRVQVIGSP